jgi:restriction system protein
LDFIFDCYPFIIWGSEMDREYSEIMAPWHHANWREDAGKDQVFDFECQPPAQFSTTRRIVESAYQQMLEALCLQLTGYIYAQDHLFFEKLVVDVVFSLGYGGRRRDLARNIGRSGDGGIDGLVTLDELGLDVIYLQAKRLKPGACVSVSAVRDFVGSLEARHATKGIFVTTGQFSSAAHEVVDAVSKKIILIDGRRLSELMARYNIGVKATDTLQFKEIDLGYFSALSLKPGSASNSSASIQPRR